MPVREFFLVSLSMERKTGFKHKSSNIHIGGRQGSLNIKYSKFRYVFITNDKDSWQQSWLKAHSVSHTFMHQNAKNES